MGQSVLTDEQQYEMNYGVAPDRQEDAAKKLRKMGVKVRKMEISIWLVEGKYISPATMIKRLEEGFYASKEKETDTKRDAEVEVPARKGRSTRPVGSGVDSGDTNKRVGKLKGSRRNGSRTSKAVRRSHSEVVEQESPRETRKKTSTLRKRSSGVSRTRRDNNTRETRVERGRESRSDKQESRGAKRNTRPRQKTSRRRY